MTIYRKKKLLYALGALLLVLLLCVGGVAIYAGDYYRASDAVDAYEVENIEVYALEWDVLVYEPASPVAGLIFYPGGKVEYTAYEPLMKECAARGILCVLVKMPLNLAVLDMNAADGIADRFENITSWYIGGHSLGGAMASSYLEDHHERFDGLVLLAAYSTADLSDTELSVLSLVGSEDGVMNREKYDECRVNLPPLLTEITIEGGIHAYFGMYGEQKGDGTPAITPQEQITFSANAISEFINKGE